MHKEQQQHLKSNNLISKLAVVVLSIVLLTGISLVPALQGVAYGQSQQQQPQQQNQVGLSQVIKQIAQQVVIANPGTSATHVQQILIQLAKQTAQTASREQAIQEIRQISSQITKFPFGTVSQSLAHFAQQVASGNSNVVQIVQQTVQEKTSSAGSSKNITQTISNTAVQQASGGSKNVNQVIRQAAQILANRAGVPVEKVEAVIIQMALQIAQAQGKSITGQSILQIANQITQNPNGVLAQAILKLVNQDDGGKSSRTTTVIKNVVKSSSSGDGDGRGGDGKSGGRTGGDVNICVGNFINCPISFSKFEQELRKEVDINLPAENPILPGQAAPVDTPPPAAAVGKTPAERGIACTQSMSASSIACNQGRSVEEVCADMPETQGCKPLEPSKEIVPPIQPPVKPIEEEPVVEEPQVRIPQPGDPDYVVPGSGAVGVGQGEEAEEPPTEEPTEEEEEVEEDEEGAAAEEEEVSDDDDGDESEGDDGDGGDGDDGDGGDGDGGGDSGGDGGEEEE